MSYERTRGKVDVALPVVWILSTRKGTDRGGIATAVAMYERALAAVAWPCVSLPTHDATLGIAGNVLLFAKMFGRLVVLGVRVRVLRADSKILYLHVATRGSLVRKVLCAALGRLGGSIVIVHHHSPKFYRLVSSRGVSGILLRSLCRLANRNLLLTNWWREVYDARNMPRLGVVPNAIQLEDCWEEATSAIPEGDVTLVSIARLVVGKNVDLVIRSLTILPSKFRLIVGGDGVQRRKLETLAADLGVGDRVSFRGWVKGDEKQELLSQADVFVLPSEADSFGMVFLEALWCGTRVVAGDVPAVKAALEPCAGVTYAPLTATGLARAIRKSIDAVCDGRGLRASVQAAYGIPKVAGLLKGQLRQALIDRASQERNSGGTSG